MSEHVFFTFSSGLGKPVRCPRGTLAGIMEHVREVEAALGLTVTQYLDNPPHWDNFAWRPVKAALDDKILCRVAQEHNEWVRWLYGRLAEWGKKPPTGDTESLTPKRAAKFWHALEFIDVEPERWTADYYRDRMEHVYEVLRRGEHDGTILDAEPLSTKQADAVICLFSEFLDSHDIRLAVPWERDELRPSDGYRWCDKKCYVAIHEDDLVRGEDKKGNEVFRCPKCNSVLD